jgi:hypothetical protein
MDKIPFSVYDFFGYLASGFVLLVGVAASFTNTDSWQNNPTLIISILLVIGAYTVGQVIANIAGFLLESVVIAKLLRRPSVNLMATDSPPKWRARFFPGYYRALPAVQRDACLSRAGLSELSGEGLFYKAFAVVKRDESAMSRLSTFLNLYGFCRNMTIALAATAVCLVAGSLDGTAKTGTLVPPGWCALLAACLGAGLFYRYLKFFRQYSVELFITYAETSE